MTSVLDLPAWQGQRSASFGFELFETVSGRRIGPLHPDRASTPTLEHDTTRSVKRRLSSLLFTVAESALVDPLVHSLRVEMLIAGDIFPLGAYQFADASYQRTSAGLRLAATCVDRGLLLQEELDQTHSVRAGTNVAVAILAFLELIGVTDYRVDGTSAVTSAAITWAVSTPRNKVLADLALAGGYLGPWFDDDDTLRFVQSFDPAAVKATYDYDDGPVLADGIVESNDLLSAPNRFRVIDSSTSTDAIVGIYDIPASAPHSYFSIGRRVTKTKSLQGLLSTAGADQAALAFALQTPAYETATFNVPPDPRHESYDVIRWQGENWLELYWKLPLVEGGQMSLRAQKAYR